MLFNCVKKHEKMIARFFKDFSKIKNDDIDCALIVIRTKRGRTMIDYDNLTMEDQLLMAEHIRMNATMRFMENSYPGVFDKLEGSEYDGDIFAEEDVGDE